MKTSALSVLCICSKKKMAIFPTGKFLSGIFCSYLHPPSLFTALYTISLINIHDKLTRNVSVSPAQQERKNGSSHRANTTPASTTVNGRLN